MTRASAVPSIALFFLSSFVFPRTATSQCADYSTYIHWESLVTMQNAGRVLLSGNLLYVTRGPDGVLIMDVSNPDQPVPVGSVDTPGYATRLVIAGNYAYVADANMGLQVIDISNPGAPVIVGNVVTNYASDVAVDGSHAYVADYTSGLRVIDISNPAGPVIVGTADTPGTTRSVAVSGNYAYIGDGYATYPYPAALRVIDVSNPASPVIAGSTDTVDAIDQIVAIGNFLYAVSQSTPGFRIFNVSNPASPVLTGSLPNFWASGLQVAGTLAYITGSGGGGLHIVDISNPFNPVRVSSVGVPGNAGGIALAGGHAYVTSTSGINIIATPSIVDVPATAYVPLNYVTDIAVTGDIACVAHNDGLRLVYISVPPSAGLAKYVATPEPCFGVEAAGNFAYVAGYHNGLVRIDISDPMTAAIVDSVYAIEHAYDVALTGDHACVAAGMEGVYVVDINTMSVVGNVNAPYSNFRKIAAAGNYAYALTAGDFQVIDISDPAHPAVVWLTPVAYAPNVTVGGNYAYLAADNPYDITEVPNIKVFDISTPANPIQVGSCETPGTSMAIAVAGNVAYSADYNRGVQVIDIFNPANPTLVGGFNPAPWSDSPGGGGLSGAVTVAGDYVYAGIGPGMVVLPAQCQSPVPVLFTNIEARSSDGAVTIEWELTVDEPLSGFEVYRTGETGGARLLNAALLAPAARMFADRAVEPGKRYEYVVAAVLANGDRIQSQRAIVRTMPLQLTLYPNHPNPFNPQTTLSFVLPSKMRARLSIFDVQGRLVRTLVDREMTEGRKEITWDGRDRNGEALASGVYFYRLDAGGRHLSGRMVLLK